MKVFCLHLLHCRELSPPNYMCFLFPYREVDLYRLFHLGQFQNLHHHCLMLYCIQYVHCHLFFLCYVEDKIGIKKKLVKYILVKVEYKI
jgi:hypothetical protein